MKIAHICPFVCEQLGGSERYVSKIAKVQSQNHDVHIYTTTRHMNRAGTRTIDGITVHRTYSPLVIWNIEPVCLMIRKLTKSDADIFHIHSYLYTISAQAVLSHKLRNRAVLLQLHGGLGLPPYKTSMVKRVVKSLYDRTLGAMVIENSDVVTSVSRTDLEFVSSYFNVDKKSLQYVANAVDITQFYPHEKNQSGNENSLLYVGDLEPWKGLDLIYKWLESLLITTNNPLVFRFVGQGSYHHKLRDLQKRFESKNNGVRIELLGQRTHWEIPKIMRSSDALVFTSYWEGLPTVILEAMATGIPVITTSVGDIPRLIQHEKTGILIERTIKSLNSAIQGVLNKKIDYSYMTKHARNIIESQYSFQYVNDTLDKLYCEII